jgi:hypothetical protein
MYYDTLPKIRVLPPGKYEGKPVTLDLEEMARDLVGNMSRDTVLRVGYRGIVRMALDQVAFQAKLKHEERENQRRLTPRKKPRKKK